MAKQSLTQEMKLTQKLSPLQIQTIKLLELPTLELAERIQRELEDNPVLDEVVNEDPEDDTPKNVALDDKQSDSNEPIPSYKLRADNYSKDKDIKDPLYTRISVKESFHQSLVEQLGYVHLDERQHQVALFVIGMLDDDGYLRRDLESLSDDISFKLSMEVPVDELEEVLKVIQTFDPAGVGARDVQECLQLQLEAKEPSENRDLAMKVLSEHFESLTRRHYDKIMSKLDIDEEKLRSVLAEITCLNPHPGGQLDDTYQDQAHQIVPDFIITPDEMSGELKIVLPKFNVPEIRVNKVYDKMLDIPSNASKAEKEATAFIKQKYNSAKWFVEALKQREKTLRNTMTAIFNYQRDFFTEGDEALIKPMVLKDIAEITNLDISTISRVVASKYVQTPFGIYSLKFFFSEGLATQSGEEASTREIKSIMKESIGAEDKHKPLTDEQLVEVLKAKGYEVARRTVAKYRDMLDIPIARLRKEL
ncbi:MAG: RNA polymerase factor sigma-54 [Bacteroidales bacterium]|nr:RNA polymerase factor sigma-54 [Candidatus Equibacterium intestinale]